MRFYVVGFQLLELTYTSTKQRNMKRERKEKLGLYHKVNSHLKQESVVFIQTDTLNVRCMQTNIELGKLKLRRY
jgi:hypothetical protein